MTLENLPKDSLMSDDQNVFRAFQLHDDGLKSDNYIAVRLSSGVAIVVLVLVTSREICRVQSVDLLVSEAIAQPRTKFIQGLPLKLLVMLG